MSYEALEAQIRTIPEEYFPEVAHFLDSLKERIMAHQEPPAHPRRKLGGYEGQIKIADDFDQIPEGFGEYI